MADEWDKYAVKKDPPQDEWSQYAVKKEEAQKNEWSFPVANPGETIPSPLTQQSEPVQKEQPALDFSTKSIGSETTQQQVAPQIDAAKAQINSPAVNEEAIKKAQALVKLRSTVPAKDISNKKKLAEAIFNMSEDGMESVREEAASLGLPIDAINNDLEFYRNQHLLNKAEEIGNLKYSSIYEDTEVAMAGKEGVDVGEIANKRYFDSYLQFSMKQLPPDMLDDYGKYIKEAFDIQQRISEGKETKADLAKSVELDRKLEEIRASDSQFFNPNTQQYTNEQSPETEAYQKLVENQISKIEGLPRQQLASAWKRTADELEYLDGQVDSSKKELHEFIKTHSTMAAFSRDEKLNRLMDIRTQKKAEFDALNKTLLLNENPAKLEGGFWSAVGQGLLTGVGSEKRTNVGQVQDFVSAAQSVGLEPSKDVLKRAELTFGEKAGLAVGQSIPAMVELGISTVLTEGVATASGLSKLGQMIEAYSTVKWGKRGKFASELINSSIKGATTYGITESDDLTASMGAAEGIAQKAMDKLNPESWLKGSKWGRGFAYFARVGAGATAETIQEYAGDLADNLQQNGLDWQDAFNKTFGRDFNEATDKLLLTYMVSGMFSGTFNAKALITTKQAIETMPEGEQKDMLKKEVAELDAEQQKSANEKTIETKTTPQAEAIVEAEVLEETKPKEETAEPVQEEEVVQQEPVQETEPVTQEAPIEESSSVEPSQEEVNVIAEKLRSAASFIRQGKIEEDIAMSGIPFMKEVWNGAIEVAATTLEGGAKLSEAINSGLTHIKDTEWYKSLNKEGKQKAEGKYKDHIKSVLAGQGLDAEKIVAEETVGKEKPVKAQVREATGQKDISDKKTLTEKQLLKEQLKNQAKGAKSGAKAQQTIVQDLSNLFNESLKAKSITAKQAKHLTKMLSKVKVDNSRSVDEFLEVADKIIEDADYADKLDKANTLKTKIKGVRRADKTSARDKSVLKLFQSLRPSKVIDISSYLNIAQDLVDSRTGKEVSRQYTSDQIADFIANEEQAQSEERKQRLMDDFNELKEEGSLPEDYTFDNYMVDLAMVEQGQPVSEKLEKSKSQKLAQRLSTLIAFVKDSTDGQYSGLKKIVSDILFSIDPKSLTTSEMVNLNNILNNILERDDWGGSGELISNKIKQDKLGAFLKSPFKFRNIRRVVSTKGSLDQILDDATFNQKGLLGVRDLLYTELGKGFVKAKTKSVKYANEMLDIAKKNRYNKRNKYRLGIYSFLNQGDFQERLDRIRQDANRMMEAKVAANDVVEKRITKANQRNQKIGQMILDILDKDFKDAKSIDDIRLKPGEQQIYDLSQKAFNEIKDDLALVSEMVYNKEFIEEENYFPMVTYQIGTPPTISPGLIDNDFMNTLLNKRQPGTSISRVPLAASDKVYDMDFFSVFGSKYYESAYAVENALGLKVTEKIMKDKDFAKSVTYNSGGEETSNYKIITDKIAEVLNDNKNSGIYFNRTSDFIGKSIARVVSTLLNNVGNAAKQYVSPMANTLAVTGVAPTAYAVVGSKLDSNTRAARKKLIEQSSLITRSYRGEEVMEKNYDFMDRWLDSELYDTAADIAMFIPNAVQKLVETADATATGDTFIAAYVKHLIDTKKIKDISEFNIEEHALNPDPEALSAAESVTSMLSNPSSKNERATVLKAKSDAEMNWKRFAWTMKSFALNSFITMRTKGTKALDQTTANEDERREAQKYLAGYIAQLVTFHGISLGVRTAQAALASTIAGLIYGAGAEDGDEDKAQTAMKLVAYITSDAILSGQPSYIEGSVKVAANNAWKFYNKISKEKAKKEAISKGETLDPNEFGGIYDPKFNMFYVSEDPAPGPMSIVINFASDGAELAKDAISGEADKEDVLLKGIIPATSLLLQWGDLYMMSKKVEQEIKKIEKSPPKKISKAFE